MKVLFDTDVIIDALQNGTPFCDDAQKVFVAVASHRVRGIITAKSINEIYYIANKFLNDDAQARNIIQKLFSIFEVVDTSAKNCKTAIKSSIYDYEDAILVETAIVNNCDCIVTRSENDFTNLFVPVFSPDYLLNML